jgi:catechol 2,3-dioxygenase-like lactoylglutathione lyase family enzyme
MTAIVHHVGFTVSDLERSLGFWEGALGMRQVMRQERRGGYLEAIVKEPDCYVLQCQLELTEGGTRVELFQYVEPEGDTVRTRPRDVGFAHVAVRCDAIEPLLERLVAAGGTPFGEVVEVDGGANKGAKAVYVRDPDGHVLELFSPAPPAEAAS